VEDAGLVDPLVRVPAEEVAHRLRERGPGQPSTAVGVKVGQAGAERGRRDSPLRAERHHAPPRVDVLQKHLAEAIGHQ
jgi:hypothetical protein